MLLSVCTVAFAEEGASELGSPYPIIFVKGFGGSIYKELDTDSPKKLLQTKSILSSVPDIIMALFYGFITENYEKSADKINSAVNRICDGIGCDENGNPIEGTGVKTQPVENIIEASDSYILTKDDADYVGNPRFEYDYRKDPMLVADELNAFIKDVKRVTGKSKVILVSHSEGTCMTSAYLTAYGSDDLAKLIFLSGAYQGLSTVSQIFTKQIDCGENADEFELFISTYLKFNKLGKILIPLVRFLNKTNALDRLLHGLNAIINTQFDRLLDGSLRDTFSTMPALWTFVEPSSYEAAKAAMFGDDIQKYSSLIKKTDYYCYNVQQKLPETINNCIKNGVPVLICSGYAVNVIPLGANKNNQSDFLIDTLNTSIGATCSEMEQVLKYDGKFVSPDKMVDASTCLLPEQTWFFKYQEHNSWSEDYMKFLNWAIAFDGQPTINDNPEYPQFMELTGSGLIPVK